MSNEAKLIHIVNNIFYNYVQVPGSCMHDYTKIHLLKLNDCTIPLLRELDKLCRLQRDEINEYLNRDEIRLFLDTSTDQSNII